MPGGAAGELFAFKQDNVTTTSQREMVGKAASHNASAHNDHICPTWQIHKASELNNFDTILFYREECIQIFTKAATISGQTPF
jgi:hypothetical protein